MRYYDIYIVFLEYNGVVIDSMKIKFQERIREGSSVQAITKMGKSDYKYFKEAKVVTDIRDAQYAVLNENLKDFIYFRFIFDYEIDNFSS